MIERLTEEQKAAVMHIDGPALVVAGAGTGKTYTLTARMAYLIEHGIDPERMLVLTFTNAAADEMKKRAVSLIGDEALKITASTYHSFCSQILRKYNYPYRDFTILDANDETDLIQLVKSNNTDYKIRNFPKAGTIQDIFSAHINRNLSIHDVLCLQRYSKYEMHEEMLCRLFEEVSEYKKDNRVLGFDDLLTYIVKFLKTERGRDVIERYKYIMVDEAQDTNFLQLEMCRLMSDNIMFIGDAEQSIYGFRGSEIRNFTEFPAMYPDTKIYTLSKNYRSTEEILAVANSIIEDDDIKYKSILNSGKNLTGNKPYILEMYSQKDETDWILNKIKKTEPKNKLAVIYRNNISVAKLESLLVENNILYIKRGGTKFFDISSVRDMSAFMKIIVNNADHISWFRVLTLFEEIGEIRANKLINTGGNFLENNEFTSKDNKTAKIITDSLNELKQTLIKIKKEEDFITQINLIRDFYLQILKKNIEILKKSEKAKESTIEAAESAYSSAEEYTSILVELMKDYDSIIDFLDKIILQAANMPAMMKKKNSEEYKPEEEANDENSVILTTVHSAKGLEWDDVILMDAADGMFPKETFDMSYEEEKEQIDEERRCMYVACTRSRYNLYVMYPKNYILFGKPKCGAKISRFLRPAEMKGLFDIG